MAPLTFHFSSPRELVAKLARDRVRLCNAISTQDKQLIADSLFDFANTGYCVKDWLKEHATSTFSGQDVENHVKTNPSLKACRDICNANKHHTIRNYVPLAADVYASLSATVSIASTMDNSGLALEDEHCATPHFKVKIVLTDGRKFELVAFSEEVVDCWERFLDAHNL
jgi:hypothetical protein